MSIHSTNAGSASERFVPVDGLFRAPGERQYQYGYESHGRAAYAIQRKLTWQGR